MGGGLPRAVQTTYGVELRVVDYVVENMQAIANSAGVATLTTKYAVDPDKLWRGERLVVQSNSANKLSLQVTDGSTAGAGGINLGLRDFGQEPPAFAQVAEYPSMLTLLGGQQFTLIATGAAPGDIVAASFQYAIVMKVPVHT